MDAQALTDFAAKEWEAVSKAPLIFLGAVAAAITIVWTMISFLYSSRISSLEGRLQLKDDQISNYKIKLDGATPEEAKARLDKLEAKVEDLKSELEKIGETDFVANFEAALEGRTLSGGTY